MRVSLLGDEITDFEGMGAGVWGWNPQLGDERADAQMLRTHKCCGRTNVADAQTSRTHLSQLLALCRTNVVFLALGRTYVVFLALGRTYVVFLA